MCLVNQKAPILQNVLGDAPTSATREVECAVTPVSQFFVPGSMVYAGVVNLPAQPSPSYTAGDHRLR